MSNPDPDKKLDRLVQRSLVPRGYRPRSDAEIEKLLDTVEAEPYSAEKLARMLRKVKGLETQSVQPREMSQAPAGALSEAEQELAELYRSQGKPLPPDLEAKLKEMERRAAEPGDEDENGASA